MTRSTFRRLSLVPFALLTLAALPAHAESECKPIHADLVEALETQGCNAGESFCFLGVVDGNQGVRGTTHFKGDSSSTSPPTSPGSTPYSGPFTYRLAGGTISMRETGITVPGVVTAHQRIVEGTGDFAGATGDFFVSGYRANGIITTKVTGMLCLPGAE